MKAEPRWRTTSLPMKNSLRGKKKEKGKRTPIKDFFMSMTDIRSPEAQAKLEENPEKSSASRRHSASPTKSVSSKSMSRALSYDALESDRNVEEESSKKTESVAGARKISAGKKSFYIIFQIFYA